MVKYYTLIFVVKNGKVLLGYKLRGFGKNKWNGFGGKVECNEDIGSCAIRELYEECYLEVNHSDIIYLGYVHYDQCSEKRIVYIYTTEKFHGTAKESKEMTPLWFSFSDIPYDEMWPDTKSWLHLVLAKSYFKCYFLYTSDGYIESEYVLILRRPPRISYQNDEPDVSINT